MTPSKQFGAHTSRDIHGFLGKPQQALEAEEGAGKCGKRLCCGFFGESTGNAASGLAGLNPSRRLWCLGDVFHGLILSLGWLGLWMEEERLAGC